MQPHADLPLALDKGALEYTLSNGLTVILQEDHFAPVTAMQVWVKVGSNDEREDQAGMAHVLEHMLFKGTERRAVGQIAQEVENSGGDINAWTSFDQTVYHIAIASRFQEFGLDILADAIAHSALDPEELARELEVIVEEIKRGKDDPEQRLSEELFASVFKKHPLGKPIIGTETSVRSFTREKLLEFTQTWYVPENMTLVVVGDFELRWMKNTIERFFGTIPAKSAPEHTYPAEPTQETPREKFLTEAVQEAQFGLAYPLPGLYHEDLPALDLLGSILGSGESSRLNSRLKRQMAAVSDVIAYPYVGVDQGIFFLEAGMPTKNLEKVIEALGEEIERIRRHPPEISELSKAKSMARNEITYQTQTVQGKARRFGYFKIMTGDLDFHRRYLERIERVTCEDIRRVAQTYFNPRAVSAIALLPESEPVDFKEETPLVTRLEQGCDHLRNQQVVRSKPDTHGIVKTTLDNGVTLLIRPNPNVPLVSIQAAVPAGLRLENEQNNGINRFIATLLTMGTPEYDAHRIADTLDRSASTISGFSGRNTLGLRAQMIRENYDTILDLYTKCLLSPIFAPEEIEKEKIQTLEEIRTRNDHPGRAAFELFAKTLFTTHPFRMNLLGTKETVSAFTQESLTEYYRRHLSPKRLIVSVVGDVDPEKVIDDLSLRFGKLTDSGEELETTPQEPTQDEPRKASKALDKMQSHLLIGFHGLDFKDPDRHAMQVFNTILSGQGGRLFLELRDRQSLAYSVGSYNLESIDPGYFAVYIGTSPDKLDAARNAIREQLEAALAAPPSDEEIRRARRYLIGSHAIGLQKNDSVASSLLFDEMYELGYDSYTRYSDDIAAVTAEDVWRLAKRIIRLDVATEVVVGPDIEE